VESLISDNNHIHSYIDSGDSNHRPAHKVLQGSIVHEGGKGEEMDGSQKYAELIEDLQIVQYRVFKGLAELNVDYYD